MTSAADVPDPPPAWHALPPRAVFELPVADTRSPLSSVLLRASPGGGLQVDAAIAADFPLVEWRRGEWRMGAGLAAGAFMQFGAGGELTFDLATFDGLFVLPVDVASGRWSARAQWVHVSAHYGDGVRKGDTKPTNLDAWSRELVQVTGAVDLGPCRFFAGARAIVHSLPEAKPFAGQLSAEIRAPWTIHPYVAVDVQSAQEHGWTPAGAAQAGVEVDLGLSRFRAAIAGRLGPDDTGKLAPAPDRYLGFLVGFGRTGG